MTDPQAEQVYSMLAQGFGVEDIAVKAGIPVDEILEEVKALRRHHQLAVVLKKGARQ
jgi:hypothetical protein